MGRGRQETLESGVDDSQRGGLKGRYAVEALLSTSQVPWDHASLLAGLPDFDLQRKTSGTNGPFLKCPTFVDAGLNHFLNS